MAGDTRFSWLWVVIALVWLLLPLPALSRWRSEREVPFTWLLVAVSLGLVPRSQSLNCRCLCEIGASSRSDRPPTKVQL